MEFLGTKFSNEAFEGLRTIVVPSGIGELQWSMTKYVNTGEDFCILGLDGAPRRLHQFCELLPNVKAFGYTNYFDYTQIRQWQDYHKLYDWETVSRKFAVGQLTALACNPHLEAGKPLADWLPDLPTTYEYKLETTEKHKEVACKYLSQAAPGDILIGISCASYRGADAWNTWKHREWLTFLGLVRSVLPSARFVLLGGSWDDLTASIYDDSDGVRWLTDGRGFPPVGRTDFGAAVELLKGLSGYIGFSSGLGHVALHCCQTPVLMLWPDHEHDLSRSWVNPERLDDGTYVPSAWNAPEDVFRTARKWLRQLE